MASSSTPTSIGSSGYGTLTRSAACNKIAQKTNSAFGSSLMVCYHIFSLKIPRIAMYLGCTVWIVDMIQIDDWLQRCKVDVKTCKMNREDHERERLRWQQKLDETESRLAEAEIINSEMNQLKAELNKRIVEMERNQKPLIEQNRRLSERNRLLQNEIKKGEQRLCHSQDDFLTLKDGYERLMKENQSLKEKRAFPEKLEELDRYRNQVLEYSKCITALRQSALEKDRRYEMLVQKFKRLRKCVLSRRHGDNDDDRQSSFGGSDCSAESSISLDTITENFGESLEKDIESNYQQLAREHDELQRALSALKMNTVAYGDEQILRDQLLCAQTTISQQQRLIEQHTAQSDNAVDLLATITRLQDQIIGLQAKCERLERELSDTKENNELLEFQLLENNENMKHELEESLAKKEGIDKVTETDKWIPEEECDLSDQIPTTLTFDQTCDLKRDLLDLKKLAYLDDFQRSIAHRAQLFIEFLENQMLEVEAKNNLQMRNYEAKEAEREKLINELQAQIDESYSKQKKKKELQIEVENLRKNIAEMENEKQKLLQTITDNTMEVEKQKESLLKENTAKIAEIENAKEALSNRVAEIEREKDSLLRRIAETENETNELKKCKDQMHSQNQKLLKQMDEVQNEKTALMKAVVDAEMKQQKLFILEIEPFFKLNDEVNNLSKELGKLRYCLQQKDELIANEKKLQNDLKSNVDEVSKNHQRVVEELKATTVAQKEELEIAKDKLSQLRREKVAVEQENAKLLEDLSAMEEENQKLKDDIRPPIKTQLERRFEESRYRLNCALQTVHEYEDEIVKLRRQLAEFETKLEDRSKIESDFAQLREYSQQLEKQFATQSHLIDALKEKIIQHKKFTDFLSAATDDGEHSCEDIEEKLERFCESQQDEGNRESTNLLRRLIRVRPYNSADSGEWLSNSSEALASLDERHDLSDDDIEAARRKQIIKNTRG
uniref:JAKMIP_CC3 domain-containing protein n=1 Tax=Ascaris lumbricoides TaxID=6252 RepID=A0A0M3HR79_ASCLU